MFQPAKLAVRVGRQFFQQYFSFKGRPHYGRIVGKKFSAILPSLRMLSADLALLTMEEQ